jgi:hypothetical protein
MPATSVPRAPEESQCGAGKCPMRLRSGNARGLVQAATAVTYSAPVERKCLKRRRKREIGRPLARLSDEPTHRTSAGLKSAAGVHGAPTVRLGNLRDGGHHFLPFLYGAPRMPVVRKRSNDGDHAALAPCRLLGDDATAQSGGLRFLALRVVLTSNHPSFNGRLRRRWPVAAASAFATAGAMGGTPGSPTPVGFSLEGTM